MSPENSFDYARKASKSNAENVSPNAVGIEAPEYSNESSLADQIGLSASGEDGNTNNVDINDPEQAAREFARLQSSNAKWRKNYQIGEYLEFHPSLSSRWIGGYRYIIDGETKKPYFITNLNTQQGQEKYYGFDDTFTERVIDFNLKKHAERAADKEKYVVWQDVKITGGCKFVEGLLWGEKKEPLTVSAFNLSKNLGSDQYEISIPNSPMTLSGDLTKPFFGLEAHFRPSFSLGIFGVSMDPENAQFTLSAGLRIKDIGVDVSITGKINTAKTEAESRQYVCYELLPWVGQLIDALG